MKVDVKKQLNTAITSGKVILGSNKTLEKLLNDQPKMVLLSGNCPKKQAESINYYCQIAKVPCVTLTESSMELGSACGRPHPISALSVMDEGDSTILEA